MTDVDDKKLDIMQVIDTFEAERSELLSAIRELLENARDSLDVEVGRDLLKHLAMKIPVSIERKRARGRLIAAA